MTAFRIRLCFSLLLLMTLTVHAAEPRTVRGSILENGRPVAARLYITGPDIERPPGSGDFYFSGLYNFARSADPKGTAVKYDVKRTETCREQHVTLSAHPFEVDLAPGKYTFTAERGHEYYSAVQPITVPETGDVLTVELKIDRWIDMAERGWYSGDTHLHRKLEDMPNLVAAEDLHVALPLTYWVRGAYERPIEFSVSGNPEPKLITIEEFLPQANRSPLKRFIWPINTEYELFTVNGKSHTQGAVLVLNHKTPLKLGAPPVGPLTQAARDEGAIFDLDKHTWNWTPMIVPIMQADLFELANNHIWRTEFLNKSWTADVLPKDWEIETDPQGYTERGWIDWGFKTYYAYLNCGFRMRPTGGTGSGYHPVPAGFGRVYVQCPGEFTYEKWMEGLNAGRSFVTTGPMLTVMIDDQPPGTVFYNAKPHTVRVKGMMTAPTQFHQVEIIVNGQVMSVPRQNRTYTEGSQKHDVEDGGGGENLPFSTEFTIDVPIEHSAWIAVRCFEHRSWKEISPEIRVSRILEEDETFSEGWRPFKHPQSCFRYAHSAPVYFEIDGPIKPRQREVNYFIQRMEQEIARHTGILADDEVSEYRKALEIYQKIAKRAVE